MRNLVWLAAGALVLALAGSANAQVAPSFGGVDPRTISFEPVDTRTVLAPIAQPQTFETSFSLTNLLSRFSLGAMSGKSVVGRSYYPTPDGLPGNAPAVVLLHGCAQNATGYFTNSGWRKYADQWRFALILAEAQRNRFAP